DRLRGGDDRTQAGAADLIDRHGGAARRVAGVDRGLPGRVPPLRAAGSTWPEDDAACRYLSRHMAMPMPPPMQSVASPLRASRRPISWSRVVSTRAPEAPMGWPMAMAPPLTFTMSGFQPSSLPTARAW